MHLATDDDPSHQQRHANKAALRPWSAQCDCAYDRGTHHNDDRNQSLEEYREVLRLYRALNDREKVIRPSKKAFTGTPKLSLSELLWQALDFIEVSVATRSPLYGDSANGTAHQEPNARAASAPEPTSLRRTSGTTALRS